MNSQLSNNYDDDAFVVIPDEELNDLKAIYKDYQLAPYVYSFINTSIKWKTSRPMKNYLTYYAPYGNWKIDGAFIIHMQVLYSNK